MNKKVAFSAYIAAVFVYILYAVVTLKHAKYEDFAYMSALMALGTVVFVYERKKYK